MNSIRMVLGACLCSASFATSIANALAPAQQMSERTHRPVSVAQQPSSDGDMARVEQADDDTMAHLAQQYALHRSSLYLYNPERIARLARAPGAAVEQ